MAKKTKAVNDDAGEIFRQMTTYVGAEEMLRKEYSNLRSLMNKRIERAKARGYMENYGYFPKLKDISNRQALAIELAQARKAYENPLTTASGRRAREEQVIKTLNDRGFDKITQKNFKLFKEFMNRMTERYTMVTPDGKKKLFDSDKAVEAFEEISERFTNKTNVNVMMRYFNEWQSAGGSLQ